MTARTKKIATNGKAMDGQEMTCVCREGRWKPIGEVKGYVNVDL